MNTKVLVLAISALPLVSMAGAASAGTTKHHKRHHHYAYRPAPIVIPPPGPVAGMYAPPRMIEARPGVWISSWDCITDEGAGRWRPCSSLGGGGARP